MAKRPIFAEILEKYSQRESWGNCIAIVVSISGQTEGPLRGKPPYFGNPHVAMDIYDKRGKVLIAQEQDLSCPGSGGYKLVEKPDWILD